MAPTMRKGSAPDATASGSGTSGSSLERSREQAKNRKNCRRCWVTWSRIVPLSIGYRASSAFSTERCVAWPLTSNLTSPLTFASVRKCGGRMTLIIAGFVPRRKARPEGPELLHSNCLRHRGTRTPARRWSQNKRHMNQESQQPLRRAIH